MTISNVFLVKLRNCKGIQVETLYVQYVEYGRRLMFIVDFLPPAKAGLATAVTK